MDYQLRPAVAGDQGWLDGLRRSANRDLFQATWGGWDEARHSRHFAECWEAGCISIIFMGDEPVGMVQLFDQPDSVEVGEIQILPEQQNRGIGAAVLCDVIDSAAAREKDVTLSLGLMNDGALRLYVRLGFRELRRSNTHIFMIRPAK